MGTPKIIIRSLLSLSLSLSLGGDESLFLTISDFFGALKHYDYGLNKFFFFLKDGMTQLFSNRWFFRSVENEESCFSLPLSPLSGEGECNINISSIPELSFFLGGWILNLWGSQKSFFCRILKLSFCWKLRENWIKLKSVRILNLCSLLRILQSYCHEIFLLRI